jgi:Pao retrotransposon peptidase
MISVTFGMISSPFQAILVLLKHSEMFQDMFPFASSPITTNTYMDNVSDGDNDVHQAAETMLHIFHLLLEASMLPHKLVSNVRAILAQIPPELICENKLLKVLGVQWNTKTDNLHFNFVEKIHDGPDTKRMMLQQSASIFDPLGLISPLTARAKILFQMIWK